MLKLLDLIDSKLSKIFKQKDDSKGLNFPNVKLSIDNLTFDDLASFYSSTDLLVFRDFVSELKVTGKSQKVKLMHFVHTHYPVNFDEYCNLLIIEPELRRKRQNYTGLKKQTICALTEFSRLVDRLKELGAFDNSFIVFKSDHGEPVWYFDRYPLNQKINEHEVFGIARYKPTLLIKPIKTTSQKLDYRNFNILVGLPDLARLHEQFNCHTNCDDVPGINLMQDDLKGEASSQALSK